MTLEEIFINLKKYSDFDQNEQHVELFLEQLDKFSEHKDPKWINELIKYFKDDTDHDYIMTSMRSAIESFDKNLYIEKIIENIPYMIIYAPLWLDNFLNRIFNAQDYREVFVSKMHLAKKEDLIKALNIVKRESEHHAKFCDELIQKLKE